MKLLTASIPLFLLAAPLGTGLGVPHAGEVIHWAEMERGWSQLFKDGRGELVAALERSLELGMSPNIRDSLGNTPLHYAALFGRKYAMQVLLNHGADPNAVNNNGDTPVHKLAGGRRDAGPAMAALLDGGANPNPVSHRNIVSPIMLAQRGRHHAMVRELESRGAVYGSTEQESKLLHSLKGRQTFNAKMKALREELRNDRSMPVGKIEERVRDGVRLWQADDPTMPDELAEEITRRVVRSIVTALNRASARSNSH